MVYICIQGRQRCCPHFYPTFLLFKQQLFYNGLIASLMKYFSSCRSDWSFPVMNPYFNRLNTAHHLSCLVHSPGSNSSYHEEHKWWILQQHCQAVEGDCRDMLWRNTRNQVYYLSVQTRGIIFYDGKVDREHRTQFCISGRWKEMNWNHVLQVKLDVSQLSDISDDEDFCSKLTKEESVILLPGMWH